MPAVLSLVEESRSQANGEARHWMRKAATRNAHSREDVVSFFLSSVSSDNLKPSLARADRQMIPVVWRITGEMLSLFVTNGTAIFSYKWGKGALRIFVFRLSVPA